MNRLLLLLCLILAALVLFVTPYEASRVAWSFDEPFYMTAARRFAMDGHYRVTLVGREHPPIYPPALPILVFSPFYRLNPNELGMGVIPVFLASLLTIACAFRIGTRLGGTWGGVGAATMLLLSHTFRHLAGCVMSDIPSLLGILITCAFVLELDAATSTRRCLAAGLTIAFTISMRVLNILILGPLVIAGASLWRDGTLRLSRVAAIVVPTLLTWAATSYYNFLTFGKPLRNAYHYWSPIPHETGMNFSPIYIHDNLIFLIVDGFAYALLAGIMGALWLNRARRAQLPGVSAADQRRFYAFAALTAGVQSTLLLFYAWSGMRLNILLVAFLYLLGGAGIGNMIGFVLRERPRYCVLLLLLAVGWAANERIQGRFAIHPEARLQRDALKRLLPADAVVIETTTPLVFEAELIEGTRRTALPLDRDVELADWPVAPRPLRPFKSYPKTPYEHSHPSVFEAGAEWAVPYTAVERPDVLEDALRAGRAVYLDGSLRKDGDASEAKLRARFDFEPIAGAKRVFRLTLPRAPRGSPPPAPAPSAHGP